MGLRGVLDDLQAILRRETPDGRHVGGVAVEVNGDDGFDPGRWRLRPQAGLEALGVEGEGARLDVDEDRPAPAATMAQTVGTAVLGAVMTASPGPTPQARSARWIASVPEPTPTAWRAPQ